MPGAFHRARPPGGREADGPSSTRLRHTGPHAVADVGAHIAGRFTRNRSFSARFNEAARGLGSTTPQRRANLVAWEARVDGRRGNCIIRDLTRRRHAASQLLMLQNPHTRRHGRRRVADKTWVQRRVARKTRPARAARHRYRYKTHPVRPKLPHLARFPLAGRVFSRYRQQQAPHATGTGTKLTLHEPRGGIFGIKLALLAQNGLIWRVLLLLGEFCPAFVANKPSRANFLPHQPRPITGTKETTPQHNTPSRAVKHLPPQHAINNPKSPIFTTQGRTFFHNTHHPHNTHPHQGELSFNHQHQDQANQQSHAIPHRPTPTQPHNPQNSNDQASHHETHPRELHAKLLERCGQAPRKVARNSIG